METAFILGRSSSKPSASDENERYYQQLGSPDLRKHYMSPTISAASKAVSSRKNILGERNEANTSHVDEKGSTSTQLTPPVSKHFDVSDDLSSRLYDPVINYSSPRPRFLRYNPDRHRELILGLENRNDGLSELSVSTSSTESGVKCDDEEGGSCDEQGYEGVQDIDETEVIEEKVEEIMGVDENVKERVEVSEGVEESDEEDEEVEEERKAFNLKGLLKKLLVFVALVLFISHIASVNQESIYESAEESNLRSQNYTCEIDPLKKLEGGSSIWDQNKEPSFIEGTEGTIGMGIEEGKMVESMQMDMVEEHPTVMDEQILEEPKVQDENLEAVEHFDEMSQVLASQAEGSETIDMAEKEENMGVQDIGELEVLQVGDIEEVHDQMVENFESQDGVVLGIDESFQEVVNENLVSVASSSFEVDGEIVVKPIDEIVVPEYSSDNMAEYVMSNGMNDEHTGHGGISDSRADVQKWGEELLAYMKPETLYIPIVVSIIAVIAASLAFIFHFRKKNATNKDSSVIENTGSMKNLIIEKKKVISKESAISHEYNSALANREKDDSIEQDVHSSFRRMSLASDSKHLSSEASEGYRSKAPTVELLGEFVVGEVSSSLRNCGLKDQRKGEETNYQIRNKAHSVSIQQQPPVSEFSYTSAFSHRSYASEKKMKQNESEISSMDTSHGSYSSKKIVKIKEGGKSGEVKIIATPVRRRSSRIRSKVANSP